jgi:hypothetical protein
MSSRRPGPIRHLSFSNVVAVVALFVALGGSAYALSKNSVKSRHIENGQVRTEDLDDSAVTGAKINGGAIKSGDVGDDELTGRDIDEESFNFADVPTTGVMSAQARQIGGDGDTTFTAVSGRTIASPTIEDVEMAFPSPSLFGAMAVFLPEALAAGESRTFTVVIQASRAAAVIDTEISCTITSGQSSCLDQGSDGSGALLAAIRIESTGAGLDPADDAYIGLAAKSVFQ